MSLLKVQNLTKEFPLGFFGRERLKAVDNVSFEIDRSKIVSLIGESGSGKTTIGKLILKLVRPSSGRILVDGKDITQIKKKDLKEYYKEVQGVFQDPFSSFNPIYKIDRVFNMVFEEFFPGTPFSERRSKIEEVIVSVGMNPREILGKYPHQLSGGQLQRILIARTLLLNVKLLIADEIISMLDASTRVDILNLLSDLRERGMSVIFITHDLSLGYYISDETFIMYRGNIVEMGDTEKVFHNPVHPYTKMLLESVPEIDKKWDLRKRFIPELIGSSNAPCKYYDRCPIKDGKCLVQKPELVEVEENHKVLCLKAGG
ncbi:ABC transporter ATP-binding protein [Thermotoga sp. KOL6]|uniref:ABC transporter ATP-binding protein n=1 Tax=Thermotoga sp. KOL6 TaxID=126741 RepID=UPI000C778531|nr:ABC transporter ATP-binding protein [Thermotoga sp. KOL6]PLV59941.1 oligopeptide ABC transporter ATP-binding protein [Thermotoga sp. KOL6]